MKDVNDEWKSRTVVERLEYISLYLNILIERQVWVNITQFITTNLTYTVYTKSGNVHDIIGTDVTSIAL